MSRGCISLIQMLMSIYIYVHTHKYMCVSVFLCDTRNTNTFGNIGASQMNENRISQKKWCLAICWWINKFNCTAISKKKYIYIYTYTNTCIIVRAKSFKSCLTLCDSMDWSLPVSSVHGILQARLLELVALPSSRESSWPRDRSQVYYVSCIDRQVLYH